MAERSKHWLIDNRYDPENGIGIDFWDSGTDPLGKM
jgi:hypothetical protein